MNNVEAQGMEPALRQAMAQALSKDIFKSLSEQTRSVFINVLFAFKEARPKIRLALVNLNGLVTGILGEDCMFGLELEAQKITKLKQAHSSQIKQQQQVI